VDGPTVSARYVGVMCDKLVERVLVDGQVEWLVVLYPVIEVRDDLVCEFLAYLCFLIFVAFRLRFRGAGGFVEEQCEQYYSRQE